MADNTYYNFRNNLVQNEVHDSKIYISNLSNKFDNNNEKEVEKMLYELKEYFGSAGFHEVFLDNDQDAKKIILDSTKKIINTKNIYSVHNNIQELKDLAIGTSGSLIATGIVGIIERLINLF